MGRDARKAEQALLWSERLAPGLDAFEEMAAEAFRTLPDEFRALCGDLVIRITEFADGETLDALDLDNPYDLLGLFEGHGLAQAGATGWTGQMPNRIHLYRRAILDYWADYDEPLGAIITHVLIHEIGHHFGLSDDDMERIEATGE